MLIKENGEFVVVKKNGKRTRLVKLKGTYVPMFNGGCKKCQKQN
jgi:hypothetical protein|nr:MAG TPA: hypothetical protein [Caudoviricetes sp.]